jgi:hypothetical protein
MVALYLAFLRRGREGAGRTTRRIRPRASHGMAVVA